MADFRSKVFITKIFLNVLFPVYPIINHATLLSVASVLYGLLVLIPVLTVMYIYTKKTKYNRVFLRKIYLPSDRLFQVVSGFEFPIMLGLYGYLIRQEMKLAVVAVAAAHILISVGCLWYVYARARKQRGRISSFDSSFKLGRIVKRVGAETERGLSEGEIVKIIRTSESGYIVVNFKGEEFSIALEDIGEILYTV
ncbi:hypothetical protein PAPHI01_2340 [Pancytospora philotis]|nr:hypothetical protein PAPHI01_2340 [Pancytospora philotis]